MRRKLFRLGVAVIIGAQVFLGSYFLFYKKAETIEWGSARLVSINTPLSGVKIIYTIDGAISSLETGQAIEYANLIRARELIINISSPGGKVFDAIEIANRIYKSRVPVTTVTRSVAASAAFYVFLSGHKRVIADDAFLMHHSMQVPPMVTLTAAQRKIIETLQERFNRFVKSIACGSDEEENELFDIKFGSEKETWIDGRRAKDLCLATELEE